ncbi:hypothetical protein EYC80_002327 [Monilinia laxa]|uniref:Uncharacterized protein n=1 Tax=Monilinia laxa TaxID=61186 RepID=A0A5N6K3G0_MONLA|nr:hypothetical protein EYC80_002327 [Monilinia laxa]
MGKLEYCLGDLELDGFTAFSMFIEGIDMQRGQSPEYSPSDLRYGIGRHECHILYQRSMQSRATDYAKVQTKENPGIYKISPLSILNQKMFIFRRLFYQPALNLPAPAKPARQIHKKSPKPSL